MLKNIHRSTIVHTCSWSIGYTLNGLYAKPFATTWKTKHTLPIRALDSLENKPRIRSLCVYKIMPAVGKIKHILKTDGASTFDLGEEWNMCTPGCSSSAVSPIARLPAIVTRQQTTPTAGMMPPPTVAGGIDQWFFFKSNSKCSFPKKKKSMPFQLSNTDTLYNCW